MSEYCTRTPVVKQYTLAGIGEKENNSSIIGQGLAHCDGSSSSVSMASFQM